MSWGSYWSSYSGFELAILFWSVVGIALGTFAFIAQILIDWLD